MWRPWVGFKKGVVQAGQVFVYVVGASAVVVVVVVVVVVLALKRKRGERGFSTELQTRRLLVSRKGGFEKGGFSKGLRGGGFSKGLREGGLRSEPRPHIQRLARGLRRGGNAKGEKI